MDIGNRQGRTPPLAPPRATPTMTPPMPHRKPTRHCHTTQQNGERTFASASRSAVMFADAASARADTARDTVRCFSGNPVTLKCRSRRSLAPTFVHLRRTHSRYNDSSPDERLVGTTEQTATQRDRRGPLLLPVIERSCECLTVYGSWTPHLLQPPHSRTQSVGSPSCRSSMPAQPSGSSSRVQPAVVPSMWRMSPPEQFGTR